jgi:serine/threonine protein kinase
VQIVDKEVTREADAESLQMELQILRMYRHPNVIHFEESFDSPNKLYIVLELYDGRRVVSFSFSASSSLAR